MAKPGDKPTDIGINRTGLGTAPLQSKQLIENTRDFQPPTTDGAALEAVRVEISRAAPPVGLVPAPTSVKGVVKTAVAALRGEAPSVFLDKLGERMAFERSGVRLYQALFAKWEAASEHSEDPTRADLERICDDELRHFALLERVIDKVGGDPTSVTPCADVIAVSSMGILQVLTDPRVTFTQALQGILTIELADNDGWRMLIDLARTLGHEDLVRDFTIALDEEDEHLMLVRRWLSARVFGQAGVEPPPVGVSPPA